MPSDEDLELLMGAYLGQDFIENYGSASAAVDAFVAREPESAAAVNGAIADLLASTSEDQELQLTLARLGNHYAADWDGSTYRAWLEEVARRIEAATRAT